MDILSKEMRSWNMSRIRAKDTAPEMVVRSILHRAGYRFRLHVKNLPGKPDIVLPRYKTVVEVRGCFWHHHIGCKYAKIPETRHDWWANKLASNIKRDKFNQEALIASGWNLLVLWECLLKHVSSSSDDELSKFIIDALKSLIDNRAIYMELGLGDYIFG